MLDQIAERKIVEAIARGELDGLPGEGRPLDLGDDALVPEDLRMAYRILKNAGFVPREIEAHKAIAEKKLALLKARVEPRYYEKALSAFSRAARSRSSGR